MNLNSIVVLLCPLLNFRLHLTLSTSIDQTSQLWALHPTRLQSTLKLFTRPDYSHLWNTSPDQTTVNFEHFTRPDYSQLWALHPTRLQSSLKHFTRPDYMQLWALHPTRLQSTMSIETFIHVYQQFVCSDIHFAYIQLQENPQNIQYNKCINWNLKNNPFTPKDLIICRVTCSWDLSVSKFCRPVFRGELNKKIYFWTWQFRRYSEHKGTSI